MLPHAAPNSKSMPSLFARVICTAGLLASLSACGSDRGPDVVNVASNIRTTGPDQHVVWDQLFDEENANIIDSDGVGFAYKSGVDANGTAVAFAGLVNADQIAPPTGTGTATYTGTSRAVSVNNDALGSLVTTLLSAGFVRDDGFRRWYRTAPVSIEANLGDGTFTGENGAASNTFTHTFSGQFVNGRITGQGRVNTGQLSSIDTRLEGRIGDEKAVMVFEGSSSNTAIAGGMTLTSQ